jgi:hypothetical protein
MKLSKAERDIECAEMSISFMELILERNWVGFI